MTLYCQQNEDIETTEDGSISTQNITGMTPVHVRIEKLTILI